MTRFFEKPKLISLLIFICALLFVCIGCTQKTNSTKDIATVIKTPLGPPEPFTLATQEIENQNMDKALRYLDLTIKDFPDNEEYVYRAYLIRNIIYVDYMSRDLQVVAILLDGLKNNPFIEVEERNRVLAFAESTLNETTALENPLLESTNYVLTHYDKFKDLDFSLIYSTKINDTGAVRDLDWFNKHKTPTPTDKQMNDALSDVKKYGFGQYCDDVIKDKKIDYPAHFYVTGNLICQWDKTLAQQLLREVINITNDDKYNKHRIDAEDVLSKNFK